MLALLLAVPFGFPQNRVTFTENFDGVSQTFTRSPLTHWSQDTLYSASGKKSMWGMVPNAEGDSVELISPLYDLTNYAYAYLRFSHICKVSDSDEVTIEYKEDYVGSKWTKIPATDYKGNSLTYRRTGQFNQASYSTWKSNDMMARPENSWWKTESFNISEDVAYAKVQFKFKIKKKGTVGTNFAWGWFIDDFELTCAVSPINPPIVEFVSPFTEGTVYSTGPHTIYAKAAKRTVLPILTPKMYVNYTSYSGQQTRDSMLMTAYDGDSMWMASIPQQNIGTQVAYTVVARDTAGNNASASSGYTIGRIWGFDSNSVALLSIDTPQRGALAGQANIVVATIQNRGLKDLTSATIQWTVNGVKQTPFQWKGLLPEGYTLPVRIGTYVARNDYDTLEAWVTMPNGVANTTADTIARRVSYGCKQIFNGTYTVGPTGNFKSMAEALNALQLCGMNGNVTLSIQKGKYYGMLDFTDYMDIIRPQDTLKLVSATGKAEDVVFEPDSLPTGYETVRFLRAHNIVLSHLSLVGINAGKINVHFQDTNANIQIDHCYILSDTATQNGPLNVLVEASQQGSSNGIRFLYNDVQGGGYGFSFYGYYYQVRRIKHITIVGNMIRDFMWNGIEGYSMEYDYVNDNTFLPRPGMNNSPTMFYSDDCTAEEICRNRFYNSSAEQYIYGVYLYEFNIDSSKRGLIANNEMVLNATRYGYGFELDDSHFDFVNNSVIINGSDGYGLYIYNWMSYPFNIYNNNMVCLNDGFPIYIEYSTNIGTTDILDYNNCYGYSYIGYCDGEESTLSGWKSISGDAHATSILPAFTDPTVSAVCMHYNGMSCPRFAGVNNDIRDTARQALTTMGCYSEPARDFNAALVAFSDWQESYTTSSQNPAKVVLMNAGSKDTLRSCTIQWTWNGVAQTPYQWKGTLIPYATDTVTIGKFTTVLGVNNIMAYVTMQNGMRSDMKPSDDTIRNKTYGCTAPLSGVLTIGSSNADYATFSDAVNMMRNCGISAPVTFKVQPGTYKESLSITGGIKGSSGKNTVTFESATGKAADVVLVASGYAVNVSATSHLRFNNLTIDAKQSGNGFNISGASNDIRILHCDIQMNPKANGNSVQYGIYCNSDAKRDSMWIIGNRIDGGYYGMYIWNGTSSSASQHGRFNRVDSNVITNAYNYYMYAYYTDFTSISHNRVIAREKDGYNYFYGLYTTYCNNDSIIGNFVDACRNYIAYQYPIRNYYSNYSSYAQSTKNVTLIANNEIRMQSTSTTYGIYDYYGNSKVINNSVYVNTTYSSGYGMYIYTTSGYMKEIRNNNVVYIGGSSAYPIYCNSNATAQVTVSANNYYHNGGTNLAYFGTAYTSLAALQAVDAQATNILPAFINLNNDMQIKKTSNNQLTCPTNASVLTDFFNRPRDPRTTIRGAYNEVELKYNASLAKFTSPSQAVCKPGDNIKVSVVLENTGDSLLTAASVYWSVNGVAQKQYDWTGSLKSGQTDIVDLGTFNAVINSNNIVAYVVMNGQKDALPYDDTISTNVFGCTGGALTGKYSVGGANADFATLDDAVIALTMCGLGGPVEMRLNPGKYNGMAISGLFLNGSSNNTVTFTSATGKREDVVLKSTTSTTDIMLENAGYINFRNLTIGDTISSVQTIQIVQYLTDVSFYNCVVYSMPGSTNSSSACVYRPTSSSYMVKTLSFTKCRFYGGYQNIHMYYAGTSSSVFGAVKVDSCELLNAYYYAYNSPYPAQYILTARDNYIHNAPNANYFYAFRFGSSTSQLDIDSLSRNVIWCNANGTNYGLNIGQTVNYYGPMAYQDACFHNNLWIFTGNASTSYGFYYGNMSYMDWRHNTFYMNTTGTRYALYVTNTGNYNFNFYDNLIYMAGTSGTAECVYHSSNSSYLAPTYLYMDNNVYYNEQQQDIGHGANNIKTWSALVNNDFNSKYEKVAFIDAAAMNFHTGGAKGVIPIDQAVKTDLEGNPRAGYTNAGCYHDFIPTNYDASLLEITHPENGAVTGSTDSVLVTIQNMGKADLASVTVQWKLNGVLQQPYKWVAATGRELSYGKTVSKVSIGNFKVPSGQYSIVAWTENPNGFTDANYGNDTASISVIACDSTLKGTYTVGGKNADFATIDGVISSLLSCGVGGPVVFKLNSGTYDAMEIAGTIPGASRTNTVTFTSLADDASTVVIGDNDNVSLKLNAVSHLVFDKLTFGSKTSTTPQNAVQFNGHNEDVLFHNCNLYLSTTTSNSNYRVVNYNNSNSSTSFLQDVRFIGNEVAGGYYGFYLYYAGGASANCKTSALNRASIRMDSNHIYDQYCYPLYSYYYTHIESFSFNTIESRKGTSSNYGAYFYYYNLVDSVVGNRIHVNVTGYAYGGIRLYYYTNYTSTFGSDIVPVKVANNEIISVAGTTAYGIYCYYYINADIFHNSVYCKAKSNNYGIYVYTQNSTSNLTVMNNIIEADSASTNYLVYVSAAATLTTYPTVFDYNDYYAESTSKNNFYCGSARTFATWQSTYNMDGHSIQVKPDFNNLPRSLTIGQYDNQMKCNRRRNVPFDINHNARTTLTVMGCYSTALFEGYNLQVEAFAEPVVGGIQCFPNTTPVKLTLYNMGTYDADFSANPVTLYLKCESDSVNFMKKVTVNKGGIGIMKRDVFEVEPYMDITYPGMYKLTAWLEWGKDQLRSDDTLKLDYYVDKTVLPYDNNFTGTFAGVATNQAFGNISWEVVNSNPVLNPVFGTGSLLFRSSEARGSISQALFTSVSLQGTYNPHLYFWYAHDNANPDLHDQMEVRISQDGGATFKTLQTLYRYDAKCTQPTWKEYKMDLSKYSTGSCIIIAFTAYSYGGGDQTVDRVKIVAQQDMQVSVEVPSDTDFAACNLTGRSLKVYLENLTSQEVHFNDGDSITVEMSGASNFVYKQALTGRLENRELDSLILSPIDYVGGGQFDVMVYVNSIDSNAANDTAKFSLNLNPDLAVTGYDEVGFTEPGDTVYVGFTMKNIGNLEIVSPFNVKVVVNGVDTITELVTASLKPGDTLYYKFKQGVIVPMTTADQPYYLLDVYALLPCDADGDNDSVRITGNVNIIDNGILSIITPATGQCSMGGTVAKVEVRLYNNGTVDNTDSVVVTAVIDSASAVYATLTEKVAPMYGGENRNYTFLQTYRVPRLSVNGAQANYKVTVFLGALEGDIDLSNDTAAVDACVEGGVGIEDVTADSWTVGQNIPNPASELTRIPYVIPDAGILTLRIMGMNGQVLYREEIAAEAGNGDIRVNLSDLAAGVYYYSVEYRGERIVKKMNVVR